MKLKNTKHKYTYILCVLLTPFVIYRITEIEELAEAMRPDDYSMGPLYYMLLIVVGLTSNALIVLFTQFASPIKMKFRLWMKTIAVTIGTIAVGVLLFLLIYYIAMTTGPWPFG